MTLKHVAMGIRLKTYITHDHVLLTTAKNLKSKMLTTRHKHGSHSAYY